MTNTTGPRYVLHHVGGEAYQTWDTQLNKAVPHTLRLNKAEAEGRVRTCNDCATNGYDVERPHLDGSYNR